MAVSGRKISDFQGSVFRGSAEDFEHNCDPCLTEDQHIEAHGYCVECQEYLCQNCLRYHKKTKATKNHQLLDKDDMDKHSVSAKPAEVCTEKCAIHTNEIIKFFCPRHENIGCTDCMTMNHRTCGLDYIPDKCASIGDSKEYKEIMGKVEEKMKEARMVMGKATIKDKEIDCSYDKVNEEFVTFRKEINDHLDSLQMKIATDADEKKSANKQEVQEVLASCTDFTSDMKKLHSSLQHDKASGQNGQLFIDTKRAKSKLQSQEMDLAESALDKINSQITFNRNKDLESILSIQNFGKLTQFSTAAVPPRSNTAVATPPRSIAAAAPPRSTATAAPPRATAPAAPPRDTAPAAPPRDTAPAAPPRYTATAAPPRDTAPAAPPRDTAPAAPPRSTAPAAPPRDTAPAAPPRSTATAAPPRDTAPAAPPRYIAADTRKTRTFSSISHKADINVRTKSNKKQCSISGIAVLSPSKIVLADYNNNTLKLVDIQQKTVVEEKKLDTRPSGIAVLPQDQIAVTLPDKEQIVVMTTAGQLSTDRSIAVKGERGGVTYHQDHLYVLCHGPYSVNVLDMKGNIKNTISLADTAVFSVPSYIALSQDHKLLYVSDWGNKSVVSVTLQGEVSAVYKHQDLGGLQGMLVLDDGSLLVCYNNIHHVSADLTQGQKVMDGLRAPRSICYSADRSQVYVGDYSDQLKVFDIQYNI